MCSPTGTSPLFSGRKADCECGGRQGVEGGVETRKSDRPSARRGGELYHYGRMGDRIGQVADYASELAGTSPCLGAPILPFLWRVNLAYGPRPLPYSERFPVTTYTLNLFNHRLHNSLYKGLVHAAITSSWISGHLRLRAASLVKDSQHVSKCLLGLRPRLRLP